MILPNDHEKFWAPMATIRDWLAHKCEQHAYTKILEVQPGSIPIPFATEKIDYSVDKIDLDYTTLDYPDQTFDFLYCRHVLEDLQNPDFAFKELARISQNGYVETPSPLVECTRNVDANSFAHLHRGYIHHRYIVWTEHDTNTLCFLPKLPIIEYIEFNQQEVARLTNPYMWNNYYLWSSDRPAQLKMYKPGIDFCILKEYIPLLNRAIQQSASNTMAVISEWNTYQK